MVLKMVLADQEIDSVPLEAHRLKQLGYLEAMMECLLHKHQHHIAEMQTQPVFFLEVASRMNNDGSSTSD